MPRDCNYNDPTLTASSNALIKKFGTLKLQILSLLLLGLLTACGGGNNSAPVAGSPTPTDPPATTQDVWLDISNTTPSNYVWDTLEDGNLLFIDRDYIFGSNTDNNVPQQHAGNLYLRTAKADSSSTTNNHISFSVNTPVTVFIAHHDLISTKPSWLTSWVDSGEDMLSRSIYRKDFDAGDIVLGGNTVDGSSTGSMYFVFIRPRVQIAGTRTVGSDAQGNQITSLISSQTFSDAPDSSSNSIVTANPDNVTTATDTAINIPILANDNGITAQTTIDIENQPGNGAVNLLANNTVNYTPNSAFVGTDSFTYKLTTDNSITFATVTVNIDCTNCSADTKIGLGWDPSIVSNDIGYLIYFGTSADQVDTLAVDLKQSNGLDPQAPYVELSIKDDLQLASGDTVCFRISAYTSTLISDLSDALCGVI